MRVGRSLDQYELGRTWRYIKDSRKSWGGFWFYFLVTKEQLSCGSIYSHNSAAAPRASFSNSRPTVIIALQSQLTIVSTRIKRPLKGNFEIKSVLESKQLCMKLRNDLHLNFSFDIYRISCRNDIILNSCSGSNSPQSLWNIPLLYLSWSNAAPAAACINITVPSILRLSRELADWTLPQHSLARIRVISPLGWDDMIWGKVILNPRPWVTKEHHVRDP